MLTCLCPISVVRDQKKGGFVDFSYGDRIRTRGVNYLAIMLMYLCLMLVKCEQKKGDSLLANSFSLCKGFSYC